MPRRKQPALLLATCALVALGACSELTVVAGPSLRPIAVDPRLTLLDPGAPGVIVICSSGGTSAFTVSASPAIGTLLGGGTFSVADGACATAWTATAGDLTASTITVTQTSDPFGFIEATAAPPSGLPHVTVNQSTRTVSWLTNAEHGGSATFFQSGSPPPPPAPKKVVLCKEGPEGNYTFTVSASGGTGDNVFPSGTSVTIASGECKDVWTTTLVPPPDLGTTVTITENGTTALDSIVQDLDYAPATVITGTRSVASVVNYYHGAVVTYYNAFPPPPPVGGQGCTPGYWKQKQHFENWTAPYLPTGTGATDFDAAFGVNLFDPNITLLQALGQGGGGINAFGRHAAAALLNAASDPVNYNLSTAQVIAIVQQAIATGAYETAKNTLAKFNEQGCPIGRNM